MGYSLKPRVLVVNVQVTVGEYDKAGKLVRLSPGAQVQVTEADLPSVFQAKWITSMCNRIKQMRETEEPQS